MQKSLWNSLGWIIDSILDHNMNALKYKPQISSSFINLWKELDHPEKFWLMLKILMIIDCLNRVWSDV